MQNLGLWLTLGTVIGDRFRIGSGNPRQLASVAELRTLIGDPGVASDESVPDSFREPRPQ